MTTYVKPDAVLPKVEIQCDKTLTPEIESLILSLEVIDEFTVRKAVHCPRRIARNLLAEMHKKGLLKTRAERMNELYSIEPKE